MNPSANRKAESPTPPESSLPPQQPSPAAAVSPAPSESEEETIHPARKTPISPPSHPRQYRAIGLIRGIYEPSSEQMTRGTLATSEGTRIDAVLLGRLISLVKNHIDLSQEHLWVVYPRTRQSNDHLHIQIVGIWEPETLDKDGEAAVGDSADVARDGFFSIRGEVVYASTEKEVAIVKIRQSPKKEADRTKFFKIKLKGTLPDRPVGHFWDFQAHLAQYDLVIQSAEDLGMIKKKPSLRTDKKRPFQKRDRRLPTDRPRPASRPNLEKRPVPKPIISKPTKQPPRPSDSP